MEQWSASRRRILRYGGILAAIGAAGCVGDRSDRETDAADGERGTNDTGPQTETPEDAVETEEIEVDEPAIAAELTPESGESGDRFGTAIALADGAVLVGAPGDRPGVAYAFERTDGTWHQRADLEPEGADSADQFGAAVAVAGDVALVGAPRRDFATDGAGAAYVFERSGGDWRRRANLVSEDADTGGFGTAVALVGDDARHPRPGRRRPFRWCSPRSA